MTSENEAIHLDAIGLRCKPAGEAEVFFSNYLKCLNTIWMSKVRSKTKPKIIKKLGKKIGNA